MGFQRSNHRPSYLQVGPRHPARPYARGRRHDLNSLCGQLTKECSSLIESLFREEELPAAHTLLSLLAKKPGGNILAKVAGEVSHVIASMFDTQSPKFFDIDHPLAERDFLQVEIGKAVL